MSDEKLFIRFVEPMMFTDEVIGLVYNEDGKRCGFVKRKCMTFQELLELYPVNGNPVKAP